MKKILLLFIVALTVINSGCTKEDLPIETKTKSLLSVSFDLGQPASDAKALLQKTPMTKSGLKPMFRLVYEIISENTIIRTDTLFSIASTGINLKDSLEYGEYEFAVFGNYVFVDANGKIVNQQYQIDKEEGLAKISFVDPITEKSWAFGYSGSTKLSISNHTTELQIPIKRCVMQIMFQRHSDYLTQWNNVVASNIKFTNFSTQYNAYTEKGNPDPNNNILEVKNIDNRPESYYRITLFESLQDCTIDLQYITSDKTTIDFPSFQSDRKIGNSNKPPFEKNKILFFTHIGHEEEPFTINIAYDLFGDEHIFIPSKFSRVLKADSLALVDFYNALNGDKWVQPWNLELPVSTWAGVTLSNTMDGSEQRVIALNTMNNMTSVNVNNLVGYIPKSLGKLSELKELQIAANIDEIEDFLGGLPKLKYLTISYNRGANYIGGNKKPILKLSNSQTSLIDVQLDAIGVENINKLWNNTNIERLSIESIDIPNDSVVFTNPVSLPKLTHLLFCDTKTNINLNNLYTSGAPLRSLKITSEIAKVDLSKIADNFTKLEILHLLYCKNISYIPTDIEKLTSLNSLALYGVNLNGTIPAVIGNFANLIYLNLSYNKLVGTIPVSIGKLDKLETFRIEKNNLVGPIPKEVKDHPNYGSDLWKLEPQNYGFGFEVIP